MSEFPYAVLAFDLPDGTHVEFDQFEFNAAIALAEIPTADDAAAEAMRKLADVVAEVIPALAGRSVAFRAGVGMRIDRWLAEQSSGKGGAPSQSSASPTDSVRGPVPMP